MLHKDHSFHTGTIKTVPQKNCVPIFTQELFRVTIYGRVTFLQNIFCLFSLRNYKNSSSEILDLHSLNLWNFALFVDKIFLGINAIFIYINDIDQLILNRYLIANVNKLSIMMPDSANVIEKRLVLTFIC